MIRLQREDFDVGAELERLTRGRRDIGGLAAFVGLVRDLAGGQAIEAMTLEHYPAMTEKMLARIEAEARRRWPLEASVIIHRYGRLEPGERWVDARGADDAAAARWLEAAQAKPDAAE